MRLSEITVHSVLSGKNWLLQGGGAADLNSLVSDASDFNETDTGLFSAIVKFGDGSPHPCLIVKSFARGGDELDLFVHTKYGWLNIQAGGFMRAAGKYSHEIFPFEYYIASPWKGGESPSADLRSPHRKIFLDLVKSISSVSASRR